MKNEYRITEVAKFFNISRQTLIYYDKIGLFKPHKVQDENSYRYYSSQQFSDYPVQVQRVFSQAYFSQGHPQ